MNDPLVGTSLGNYSIESVLGQGGMGVVYLALDTALERRVALKVLSPAFAEDDSFKERFTRESRLAASLDHPNVVPVFDAGQHEGRLYIAMRYVKGTDLKHLIENERPLDPGRVATLVTQVAGALDAAHRAGLVHRDVKPANVLLTRFGESDGNEHAYLTDFGITKRSGSQSALTKTGSFVGTIDYMAPEQIEGKGGDHRSDVYSLGCVAYEALTGEPPFQKDTDVAVMYAHLMDERPSVTEKRPDLPPGLDDVVKRAMARDPSERHASAGELAVELARLARPVADAPSLVTAEPRSKVGRARAGALATSRGRLLALGVATVLIVALAFMFLRPSPDAPDEEGPEVGTAAAVVVAPSGSDDAAGTQTEPFGSLQHAIDVAGPGGTVVLEDGVYPVADERKPTAEIDHAVTIQAAADAVPILRGTDRSGQGLFISAGTSDVTIQGLEFENLAEPLKVFCERCKDSIENRNISLEKISISNSSSGVIVENGENILLNEIHVEDTVDSGFLCNPGPCNQLEITDSSFQNSTGSEADGIQVVLSDGVVIEDTTVSGHADDGIDIDSEFARISRTQIMDNDAAGLWAWTSEVTLTDSLVARNGAQGISVCPEGCDPGGTFSAGNILVVGNGSRTGVDAVTVAPDRPSNVTFELFNSLFTDNQALHLVLGSKVQVERLDFNIFDVISESTPAVKWDGKIYDGDDLNHSRLPGDNDSGTYSSRPEFVAPDDYHLRPGSPGVDGGTDVGMSATDLDGQPRPQGKAPDQGPYEQ